MANSSSKCVIFGIVLGMLSVLAFFLPSFVSFITGGEHTPANKLEIYECFLAIRDSENSKWENFWTKEDPHDEDVFVLQREISTEGRSGIEELKAYGERNQYRDGIRTMAFREGTKANPPRMVFRYKNMICDVSYYEKNKEITVSVSHSSKWRITYYEKDPV